MTPAEQSYSLGIYNSGNVVPDPHYLCDRPRDTELNYIIGVEREKHPDHYSRFGYARNFYGYASGHWPGRYQEDRECSCEDFNPPGMAPARFYNYPNNISQSQIDYRTTQGW